MLPIVQKIRSMERLSLTCAYPLDFLAFTNYKIFRKRRQRAFSHRP